MSNYRYSTGTKEPESEQARGQISHAQRANEPVGEQARGRTGKGAKKPDTAGQIA